mgnify:CR=1 FL=1
MWICRNYPVLWQDQKSENNFNAPIIFLTAYSGESDKVMGFSAGADDYIVKPFSNMELLMRVKAILRRSARGTAPAQEEKKSHILLGI